MHVQIILLGPRGPLRTPLVSRPVVPSSATKIPDSKLTQPLISFPSDSKLKQPLPQYTVHRTLNRINSRTFLAQFGLVLGKILKSAPSYAIHLKFEWERLLLNAFLMFMVKQQLIFDLRTFVANSTLSQLRAFGGALLAKIWWEGARKHFIRPGWVGRRFKDRRGQVVQTYCYSSYNLGTLFNKHSNRWLKCQVDRWSRQEKHQFIKKGDHTVWNLLLTIMWDVPDLADEDETNIS